MRSVNGMKNFFGHRVQRREHAIKRHDCLAHDRVAEQGSVGKQRGFISGKSFFKCPDHGAEGAVERGFAAAAEGDVIQARTVF